jgi:hyperosmotically inducible protein
MKNTIMGFAVLALSTFAYAETTTNTTQMDSAPVDSNHYDTNSNDRFNNRDTRTNSAATPATVGKENSKLGSDSHVSNMRSGNRNDSSQVAPAPVDRGTAASDESSYRSQRNRVESSSTNTAVGTSTRDSRLNTTGSSTSSTSTSMDSSKAAAGTAGVAAGSAYNTDKTAQDQGTAERELELTRRIRSEITDNKNLSTDAHNIKIISENGKVHLKGPVKSAAEKSQVEMIAKRLAGNTAVINETYVEKK